MADPRVFPPEESEWTYGATGADGYIDHSGMILAVDRASTTIRIWTIEGNIDGHCVAVKQRVPGGDALALGRITGAVLE